MEKASFSRALGAALRGLTWEELAKPSRFGACVAEVPLTDMRRYHRFLAGYSWLEEYGDPEQEWHHLRPSEIHLFLSTDLLTHLLTFNFLTSSLLTHLSSSSLFSLLSFSVLSGASRRSTWPRS